jgi:hypothetical protein
MIKKILLLITILSFGGKISSQINEDLNKIGLAVFEAVKVNDYSLIADHLANLDDMEDWMEQVMQYYPVEKQREFVANKNENAKKGIKEMHDTFQSVHQTGISSGVNWAKTKLVKVFAEYCGENPHPKDTVTCLGIAFTYLGVEYHIQAAVVKVNRGYVLVDGFKFY